MNTYLQEGELLLRPLEPEDLEILYQWENDTTLWGYGGATAPYSRFQLRNYIESATSDIYQDKQLRLMVYDKTLDSTVGIIDLFDFDPHHSRAGVGILIAPQWQQQGYATRGLHMLVHYAFSCLHIHQLYAHIAVDNISSSLLFRKVGFLHTATLQQWQSTPSGYTDVELHQLFNRELK